MPGAHQPRRRKGGAKRREEIIREIFCETRAVFANCIVTKLSFDCLQIVVVSKKFG